LAQGSRLEVNLVFVPRGPLQQPLCKHVGHHVVDGLCEYD